MALKLWSKLEDAGDVTSPQIGTGGSEIGSPTYVAAKFGNGIWSDESFECCKFPTVANSINLDKGTIEFWGKMKFPITEAAFHTLWGFLSATPTNGILFHFDPNEDDFRVKVYQDNVFRAAATTSGISFSEEDLVHFGVTWDREGNDIGDSKTIMIKINNVERASSTTTWNTGTGNDDIYIGARAQGQVEYADVVIDNLKTYDVCKTDFSDRFDEDAGANQAPTAPTELQVDGKSDPTGPNCISSSNPNFTAIFNDPEAGDLSNAIQIQVGTAEGLSDMWDSGWLADSTTEGNRCSNKAYAGTALSGGTSYWWRCRFRDDDNAEGAWSAWQEFDMCAKSLTQMCLI